jgi:hypothetical protein
MACNSRSVPVFFSPVGAMIATAPSIRRRRATDVLLRRRARLDRRRAVLPDGAATTVHVAAYDLAAFQPRVAVFDAPLPLARWCREHAVRDAIVGGFFLRSQGVPLGELRVDGDQVASEPFASPWHRIRGCVQIDGPQVRLACRDMLGPEPAGDLLQAGPLLVSGGRCVAHDGEDREGFSAGAHQFDSDITRGRFPRAALGIGEGRLLTVACDGRTARDAGMTLSELARLMLELGAESAINLDGGGSTSLVYAGRLRNHPREEHGIDLLEGRPVLSAIAIEPR